MKVPNKNNIIKINAIKRQNYIKPTNNKTIILKKTFIKSNKDTNSNSLMTTRGRLNDDSKISLNEKEIKRNQIVLPLINKITHNNRSILNFSINSIIQKSIQKSVQLSPIKKNKINISKKKSKRNAERLKNLKKVYHESYLMKQKLKRYKERKTKNIRHFSYKNYNYNLIKYSSIDLSRESCSTFKKNMESIEKTFNGQRIHKKDRWLSFLDKIGDSISEGLKKKLRLLSEAKYKNDLKKTYNSK